MIITTSQNPNKDMLKKAIELSRKINANYIDRDKDTLSNISYKNDEKELLVIEKEAIKYYRNINEKPFYFHPGIAVLRINRLKQGDNDIMIKIANLKSGDSFLDCTIGLAGDSLVASFIVGVTGKIVGFESEPIISYITSEGLKKGWKKDKDIDKAMKSIKVETIDYLTGLRNLPDKSFDVIYFDPMFSKPINSSTSINTIRNIANYNTLSIETIKEAKRVAKRKIILKAINDYNEFKRLGFKPISRSSSFTYGFINVNGDE